MPLANATKLGPYEILSPLGAGSMGEVYLARDSRLDRTVAIKVLPESLAADSDRLQRFEQEARVLSTVSHPNLLNIFDIGTQSGVHFLVSEFLEGHTLRERMSTNSLPHRKLPDYALQLANGLAAAHDKGIVHRDLKPENIFITNDDRVKILDFGLAKISSLTNPDGATVTISSPAATAPGTVLGTVGYMSPEQVRGEAVDHRSDIFSFGAILYEILSGNRAFQGDSGVETMTAILKEDPPELDSLQVKLSPALDRIVRHCLEKNPANRFQSARDLAFALGALSGTDSSTAANSSLPHSNKRPWLIAAMAAIALALLLPAIYLLSTRRPQTPERLEYSIPLQGEASHLAISTDGRMLAYVSPDDTSGVEMLTVQRVGSSKITVLAGTERASYPFWSPDDSYVAFFADGKLKKVLASGSAAPQVITAALSARGGSWGRQGVIVYSPTVAGWLWSVNADGSNAAPLTDKLFEYATSHRWPLFLPDGDHFLFWSGNFTNAPDDRSSGIYLGSLSSRTKKFLLLARSNPGYANGSLFYIGEKGSLREISLDIAKAALSGETRVVASNVGFQPSTYWGAFAVAENGTLIYNSSAGAASSALTWFARSGKELGREGSVGVLANPAISPDGNRVAFDIADVKANNVDLWIRDFRLGTNSRFTFNPAEDVAPVWSRDGNTIAYRSIAAHAGLFLKRFQGMTDPKLLYLGQEADIVPNSWSPDNSQVLCNTAGPSGSHLVLVSADAGKVSEFLTGNTSESNGQISPNGKWVAYASNETGEWEIYVTTFPVPAGKWQVSRDGGTEPRWRGDGKEIFYLDAKSTVTAVPINAEENFSSGNPTPLFQSHGRAQISSTDIFTYDVTKDGQRFLMNRYAKPEHIAPLQIVLNATSEAAN